MAASRLDEARIDGDSDARTDTVKPVVELRGITHRYKDAVAINDITLNVVEGEFLTLLGPSGCGKTTLLRMLAGFIRPTTGSVLIGGKDVTRVAPHKRPVNMVFQRPTLFPHLDVFDNVAFGLRLERLPQAEIQSRVADALKLVRLDGFENRRSHEMSGGQMQRVALARALVKRPKVLLFDEPLSALDLKIRAELQEELRRVHRATGSTFIYVTHDQGEALAMSDRIAVFSNGRIEQLGTPEEVYHAPVTEFVARFIGDASLLRGEATSTSGGEATVRVGPSEIRVPNRTNVEPGPVFLMLRTECVTVVPRGHAEQQLVGSVTDIAFNGGHYAVKVHVDSTDDVITATVPAGAFRDIEVGTSVALRWQSGDAAVLPRVESSTVTTKGA